MNVRAHRDLVSDLVPSRLPEFSLEEVLARHGRAPREVGAGDATWPKVDGPAGEELSAAEVRVWLLGHVREQLDEVLYFRERCVGVVVDVALGVRWAPSRGWAGWRRGPTTAELLDDDPEERALVARLEAAILAGSRATA